MSTAGSPRCEGGSNSTRAFRDTLSPLWTQMPLVHRRLGTDPAATSGPVALSSLHVAAVSRELPRL